MSEWMDGVEWSGVDTPQTVTTTRAPAVLKTKQCDYDKNNNSHNNEKECN